MSIPQPLEKLDLRTSQPADHGHQSLQQVNSDSHDTPHQHDFEWVELVRIGFVSVAAAAVWFGVWEPFPRISVIGILANSDWRISHIQGSLREHH